MSSLLTFGIINQFTNSNLTYPLITTDLALRLDAGDSNSYPGSGNIWYDISGNNRNMTLNNSPSYSTNNGGILQFNGTNQTGNLNTMNYSSNSFTLICSTRYAGSIRGRIVNGRYTNNIYGNHGGQSDRYYAGAWVYTGGTTKDLNWNIHAFTENYSSDLRSYYRNNVTLVENSTAGVRGFNGLAVGSFLGGTSEYSDCEVGFILVYDRVLSRSELTQTFYHFRDRYGL